MTEHRPEARLTIQIAVRIYGMDAHGQAFSQTAQANELSPRGARISFLETGLTVGDTVGVAFEERKARCRVVWTIDAGPLGKISAGVRLVDGETCPWDALLRSSAAAPPRHGERRRFKRYEVPLRFELRCQELGAPNPAHAGDVSGGGCYILTMQPLPRGTSLHVSLWLGQEKITASATIRTSDPGVGMGIEFVELAENVKAQIDDYLRSHAEKEGSGTSSAEGDRL